MTAVDDTAAGQAGVGRPADRAEVCVIACAEAFRGDGEILASPFGTIPAIGARLARHTFEPDLLLTDGEAHIVAGTWPVGVFQTALRLTAGRPMPITPWKAGCPTARFSTCSGAGSGMS